MQGFGFLRLEETKLLPWNKVLKAPVVHDSAKVCKQESVLKKKCAAYKVLANYAYILAK